MKYIIVFFFLIFFKFSFSQEMEKKIIEKKTHDTLWMTKSQYIHKTRKPMSGENDISVYCAKRSTRSTPSLLINGSFYARDIFTVAKGNKVDIYFIDGTRI